MKTKTAIVVLGALASSVAVGCGSSDSSDPTPSAYGSVRASLHRSADCGSLLSDLKADASYKMNKTIDRSIESIRACQKQYGDDQCAFYGYGGYGVAESSNFGGRGEVPISAPAADSASGATSGSANSPAPQAAGSYSQTNTQVVGVDEADIVKNDGANIYVLHGNKFKLVKAWPAASLREGGSIDIEGTPTEMFVADGRVVVYSTVNGATVFQKAGITPKTSYNEFGWDVAVAADRASSSMIAPYPGNPTPYAPLTKITLLQLDGDSPRVTGEQYFEGTYLDARRVQNHVRTVLSSYQYGPKLLQTPYELDNGQTQYRTGTQMIAALQKIRQQNKAAIDGSQIGDWLPYTFVKNGDAVTAQTTKCEDFYVPTAGSTESGMTKVSSLNLNDPGGAPKETAILGQADTVYADNDTMYLAARAWVEPPFAWSSPMGGGGGTTTASPPVADTAPSPGLPVDGGVATKSLKLQTSPEYKPDGVVTYSNGNTHLHKFDFSTDPTFPNYQASGTVQGTIKDQFSLDERDGNLRVATTESRSYVSANGNYVSSDETTRPRTVTHVSVLAQKGPFLDTVGHVGEMAPNETIMSTRFVGTRGYVVTFRQVDPLFVIDLANPTAPAVVAALKIPGFSEYMQPIDATHLLTIGRAGDDTGRTNGLALQIFDVTDPKAPKRTQYFEYTGNEYGSSDAEYDHKAFTWFPEKGLLAFPYYAYGNGINGNYGFRSSLEVFRVDVNKGFTKVTSVDNTPVNAQSPKGWYCGYYQPSVRRGVFLESTVYSISYGGIVAKDTNDLNAPGGSLSLGAPVVNDGYGPYSGGMAPVADCAMPVGL